MYAIKGKAHVNPVVLAWAREWAARTVEDTAAHMGVAASDVTAWESGADRPEYEQARVLSRFYGVPFGYFWLSQVPALGLDRDWEEESETNEESLLRGALPH